MTSPKWTRAIFVRHPKPRLLSAFLDKAVTHSSHFANVTCTAYAMQAIQKDHGGGDSVEEFMADRAYEREMKDCEDHQEDFSFFLYNVTTTLGGNVHWRSISSRIDEKWWPSINFVGNMEHLSQDAERFLKTIRSSKSSISSGSNGTAGGIGSVRGSKGDSNSVGVTAWDVIGKTGWNGNERDCSIGTSAFLAERVNRHQTSARDHMLGYYTPQLELFVENHYADDLNNHYFRFEDDIKLFDAIDQKRQDENVDVEGEMDEDDDGEEFEAE